MNGVIITAVVVVLTFVLIFALWNPIMTYSTKVAAKRIIEGPLADIEQRRAEAEETIRRQREGVAKEARERLRARIAAEVHRNETTNIANAIRRGK